MKNTNLKFVVIPALLTSLLTSCPSGSVTPPPPPPPPLNFAGSYTIAGTNPNASVYSGTMTVTAFGDGYKTSATISGSTFTGVANDINDYFAIASVTGGIPSIAVYQVTTANKLSGFWQDFNSNKEGTESATNSQSDAFSRIPSQAPANTTNYAGTYSLAGTNPDNSSYTGTVVVTAFGDGYKATVTSGGGSSSGIGKTIGNYLAFAFNSAGTPIIGLYENKGAGKLKGIWQSFNNSKEGAEELTKQ